MRTGRLDPRLRYVLWGDDQLAKLSEARKLRRYRRVLSQKSYDGERDYMREYARRLHTLMTMIFCQDVRSALELPQGPTLVAGLKINPLTIYIDERYDLDDQFEGLTRVLCKFASAEYLANRSVSYALAHPEYVKEGRIHLGPISRLIYEITVRTIRLDKHDRRKLRRISWRQAADREVTTRNKALGVFRSQMRELCV